MAKPATMGICYRNLIWYQNLTRWVEATVGEGAWFYFKLGSPPNLATLAVRPI